MRKTLLALLLLIACPALAYTTEPVNLGEAGLDLTWRLYLWDGGTWTRETALEADITASDLGSGNYSFSSLPEAVDTDRYWFVVTTVAAPAVGLRELSYGALPGQRLVWQNRLEAIAPTVLVAGQTHGGVTLTIETGLPSAIASVSTTATFSMINLVTGAVVISSEAATVTEEAEDEASGTWGATLQWTVDGGDFETLPAGKYVGQFWVTFPDTTTLAVPQDDRLKVTINRAIGAP